MNLETLTLQEQIDGLREKKFSSVELVENYISVIEDKEDLNIFVSNDFEKALEEAKKSDGSKKEPRRCSFKWNTHGTQRHFLY